MPADQCINSGLHINDGDTLVEVPDGWDGVSVSSLTVTCPLCGIGLNLRTVCTEKNTIGFHWPEHEAMV